MRKTLTNKQQIDDDCVPKCVAAISRRKMGVSDKTIFLAYFCILINNEGYRAGAIFLKLFN